MDEKIKTLELGFVNAYLLKAGDGFILVDTGLPYQGAELESKLASAGCSPGKLKLILITHGDWDHTGNVSRLREKYNVKVAMHFGDVDQVEKGVFLKRKIRPLLYRIFFIVRMLLRKLQKNKMNYPTFKPDILLSDGQSLEGYGLKAKVIHIPGHTPGSIGVITDDGDLISGDMFFNNKKPDTARIIENEEQLKNSFNKLRSMNIKMIYPGHGKPFPWERVSN